MIIIIIIALAHHCTHIVNFFSSEHMVVISALLVQEKCVYMDITEQLNLVFVSRLPNTIEID